MKLRSRGSASSGAHLHIIRGASAHRAHHRWWHLPCSVLPSYALLYAATRSTAQSGARSYRDRDGARDRHRDRLQPRAAQGPIGIGMGLGIGIGMGIGMGMGVLQVGVRMG